MPESTNGILDLRVVEYDNPAVVRSRCEFEYERANSPQLKLLRKRYRLDRVISGAKSEFEQILALRNWVSSRWDHGYCNIERNSSTGWEFLQRAEKGECFTCAVYAFTLTEVYTSMGFVARNLTIGKANSDFIGPRDEVGHCVTEVWCNELRKWVLMDADAAAHFELKGVPLNAMEVREAWLEGRWKKVRFVRGPHIPKVVSMGPPGTPTPGELKESFKEFFRHNTLDFYHHLEFHLSNAHYTGKKNRSPKLLVWSDSRALPRLVRHNLPVDPDFRGRTETFGDVYFTLNHAHISLHCRPGKANKPSEELVVSLDSQTPWLDRYEVRINGGKWQRRARQFGWKLKSGVNRIEARPVNRFGRVGSISRVGVLLKRS